MSIINKYSFLCYYAVVVDEVDVEVELEVLVLVEVEVVDVDVDVEEVVLDVEVDVLHVNAASSMWIPVGSDILRVFSYSDRNISISEAFLLY